MGKFALSRKGFLKGTAVAAGAATFGAPAFLPQIGQAADQLKIGGLDPLTGTYAALGKSEFVGMQMAVDAWNKKGGVLGREVVLLQEDDAADPGVAVQKARKHINQSKCTALIGAVSSATALSVAGAANDMGVIYMDTGGHSDDITMKDCHWTTFQICHPTWMLTHATGYAFSKYGKKWYAITPDYAYGHSIMTGYEDIAKQVGATFIGNDLTPLGTSDFGAYLPKLAASGADIFVCNLGGNDFVNCMKQAASYGIFKKMKAGGPLAELENFWASPPDARVGYWGIEWYYNGSSVIGKNKTAHEFVVETLKRTGLPPSARNAFGYLGMDLLLNGMAVAKTTDAVKVAKALEGKKFDSPIFDGDSYFRADNHALMWPMWVGSCDPSGIGGDKNNIFSITDRVAADKIVPPASDIAKACKLGYP
ncbi:MAG: ABC transporter substrate-binding protein [Vulcanimicrobiaceae bacterium]|jgi:branched-chain amino acid transport system substrate-binding protein